MNGKYDQHVHAATVRIAAEHPAWLAVRGTPGVAATGQYLLRHSAAIISATSAGGLFARVAAAELTAAPCRRQHHWPRRRHLTELTLMKGKVAVSDTSSAPDAEDTRWRMRAIADELSLAGLATSLHESRTSIDVTATFNASGQREAEVIVDEDAYVEMRFWHHPQATPAQVAALITSAMTVITAAQQP